MTADSQGPEESAGGAPAEDDPFAYLYRPAAGAEGAEQAPQAPRTAYRPMEVGRAQYGAPPPRQQPFPPGPEGRPGYPPQQPGYGGEQTTRLPQQSRYAERSRPQPGEDVPRGRGKGPVIGVVAVVAAIAIGAGIALTGNDGGKTKNTAGPTPAGSAGHSSAGGSAPPSSPAASSAAPSASPSDSSAAGGGFVDAAKAQAGGGAALGSGVKGAISADGSYLTLQQGSSASFSVTVPTAGVWKIWFHYGNSSGSPVKTAVTVNGQDHPGGTTFKSWNSGGDPAQAWSYTWISPQLQAGTNTVVVTPAGGPVLVDQLAVTGLDVNGSYPSPGAAGAAPAPASS
ncbi:hypothetical protein ACFYNO_15930 [Kitasatospora sp. NPDC006697]|uniref:hypothetical protein n=1 Tax=Kitasatospora sp. NPDC006697 TaxID=3364020 RepID=UPI0036CCAFD4